MSKLFKLLLACEEYGEFEDRALVLMIDSLNDGGSADAGFKTGAAPESGGDTCQTAVLLR